jgi:hypothetical protein
MCEHQLDCNVIAHYEPLIGKLFFLTKNAGGLIFFAFVLPAFPSGAAPPSFGSSSRDRPTLLLFDVFVCVSLFLCVEVGVRVCLFGLLLLLLFRVCLFVLVLCCW